MIEVNKKQQKIDQAWNKLYERLQKDHLIPEKRPQKYISRFRIAGAMVAMAAVFTCLIYILTYKSEKAEVRKNLYSHTNSAISTLVKTLEDGSVIFLTQKAWLECPKHFATDKRVVNLQGEAFFDIAKNSERPFYINTGKVQIKVLGTAFNVRSDCSVPFSLAVRHGKVKVSLIQGGQDVFVNAGEMVTLNGNRLHITRNETQGLFDHYFDKLRFKDESVENILRVINKNTAGLQLQTATPQLGQRKLTLEIEETSPEMVAELISMALNLQYTRQGDKLIISE